MPDSPYSRQRQVQYRGPSNSTDYNSRIEEAYQDLVVLYNKARVINEDNREGFSRSSKEHLSLTNILTDLEQRVLILEGNEKKLTFHNADQIDNNRFVGTPYEITGAGVATLDTLRGVITTPQVPGATISKLYFTNTDGVATIPSSLQTNTVGLGSTADSPSAIIDTSDPSEAIIRTAGRLWERNVVVSSPNVNGADVFLYIKCPIDLFTTANSNTIVLSPFPALGVDIVEIAYTTSVSVLMQDSDGYTPLNSLALHSGESDAIGWTPPGGWSGDTLTNAGPRVYYFQPIPITGLRIRLHQSNYHIENGLYVYSYGASAIDLLYTKFLTSGKTTIRYNVPSGVANNVTAVDPEIWNVAEADIPNVFDYKVIYETSYNSNVYTLSPVSGSTRFWVQVALTANKDGVAPALSALNITYS